MTQILLDQGKASQAYEYMRGVCHQWPESVAVWNLYARVAAAVGSAGHGNKLLTPLRQKVPHSVPLMLNLAHCCAMQVCFPIDTTLCIIRFLTMRNNISYN
jgi:predicted Zn-dependent protease